MPEQIPTSIQKLTRQYVDGTHYSSSGDVLLFAMQLFAEFDVRYRDKLASSLEAAFNEIDQGKGLRLDGEEAINEFFDDVLKKNHAAHLPN
ncbi:MAG: hypothetical protein AAGA30_02060 [Planctomycetota bacterium]